MCRVVVDEGWRVSTTASTGAPWPRCETLSEVCLLARVRSTRSSQYGLPRTANAQPLHASTRAHTKQYTTQHNTDQQTESIVATRPASSVLEGVAWTFCGCLAQAASTSAACLTECVNRLAAAASTAKSNSSRLHRAASLRSLGSVASRPLHACRPDSAPTVRAVLASSTLRRAAARCVRERE